MRSMDGWDIALLILASYVAIVALVRMMAARRAALVAELRAKAFAEKRRQLQQQMDELPPTRDRAA